MKEIYSITELEKDCILDVFADWCLPCKMIAPRLSDLDTNVPKFKINIDNVGDAIKVTALPTVIFFKDGVEVDRVVGAKTDEISTKAKELLFIS